MNCSDTTNTGSANAATKSHRMIKIGLIVIPFLPGTRHLLLRWFREAITSPGRLCRFLGLGLVGLLTFQFFLGEYADSSLAATVTLRDNRTYSGAVNEYSSIAEDPSRPNAPAGEVRTTRIVAINDELTRVFVPQLRLINSVPDQQSYVRIQVPQNVAQTGFALSAVGPMTRLTPFDPFGRRIFGMVTSRGQIDVVQGITQITPRFCRVEGLMGPQKPVVWDMRLATSSIPRETLDKILEYAVPQNDAQARLSVVRLYLQSERFRDARQELADVIRDFPDLEHLETEKRRLRQLEARSALQEIKLRAGAGQHSLVVNLLKSFPSDDVSGETLIEVREQLAAYQQRAQQIEAARESLQQNLANLEQDTQADAIQEIVQEIEQELSNNNIQHLAGYLQLAGDKDLSDEDKLAIAISGWLLGGNSAIDNLAMALSLVEIRALVRQYLDAETAQRRTEMIDYIIRSEGASVELVAKLIARMTPPFPQLAADESIVGYHQGTVPGFQENAAVNYLLQLPPEYDPHRRYPTVITLNGVGSTPELQLDFWAGGVRWEGAGAGKQGQRMGQGTRHGYIVVAIDWQKPHQLEYEYTAREHHAVLSVVRDICRRYSVDTDRLFLSGHDIGGDATWDIGLAHPDLWAGLIPIVASSDRFVPRYWQNARYVPTYFVMGEMDSNSMRDAAQDFDRYLRNTFDCTVVEYLGRGHEAFHDEIQRLYDWMGRRKRDFFPQEFDCKTMRPWDSFFWWLEFEKPNPPSMVSPVNWPPPRNTRPLAVSGRVNDAGNLVVQAKAEKVTVWLSPEFVDFDKRVIININRRRATSNAIEPSLRTLLEDVRTRADRAHPFWAKVESN